MKAVDERLFYRVEDALVVDGMCCVRKSERFLNTNAVPLRKMVIWRAISSHKRALRLFAQSDANCIRIKAETF